MHQLHRDPVLPAGLARYKNRGTPWSSRSPTSAVRSEIWGKLDAMQGQRCAYCEAVLFEGERHIEHFRQRSRYPQGTYDWGNLFGSCNRHNTCGKHKDQCDPYPHTDLIKPDRDDPQAFLVFSPDGSVQPRARLNTVDRHRAAQTIRIFNLNGALRRLRYAELSGYLQTAEYFAALAAHYDEAEWLPLLQEEIAKTAHLPYATAIKHVLTRHN